MHHLEHPDVLELGRYMEAVKTVRVTARVGADALHKVRCAGLQLADHLRKRVLEDRKQNFYSTSTLLNVAI